MRRSASGASRSWTARSSTPFTFAKLKALLRKAAERTIEGLWRAIGHVSDRVTPQESANFFTAAGYEPD
jgi:hypothetical protein